MKSTILIVAVFSSLFLMSSCEKEKFSTTGTPASPVEEVNPLPFQKEVAFTDSTGKNSVIVRFSATKESLLQEIPNWFSIEPIFEIPKIDEPSVANSQSVEEEPAQRRRPGEVDFNIEVLSQQLEEGALGVKLSYMPVHWEYARTPRYDHVGSFETTYNTLLIRKRNSICSDAEFFNKRYSSSNWESLGYRYSCSPFDWFVGSSSVSFRMKVIYSFNTGARHDFYYM